MSGRVIANPIINSPFAERCRHFRFDDEGITDEIIAERRKSGHFVPLAPSSVVVSLRETSSLSRSERSTLSKRTTRGKQLAFSEWTADRIEENKWINSIRERVKSWRDGGYALTTHVTRRLLEHWQKSDRYRRLFYCQIEALETLIYIAEAAERFGDPWITNDLQRYAVDD